MLLNMKTVFKSFDKIIYFLAINTVFFFENILKADQSRIGFEKNFIFL